MTRAQAADAMAQIGPVNPAGALDRPMMHRKCNSIPLLEWNNLWTGLHTWPLLRQYKLAARKITARLGQQDGELNGEYMFPVQILVQAIVIPRLILQQQRGRTKLACLVAAPDKIRMLRRVTHIHAHCPVPAIGNWDQVCIDCSAQI